MNRDDAPRDRLEERIAGLLRAFALKGTTRAGWLRVGVEEPESVGDHSWGTALLALEFAADAGVPPERAVAMAVVHDLPEAITGDVPYRPGAAARQRADARADAGEGRFRRDKAQREAAAMAELTGEGHEARRLWEEYEAGATLTAQFVRDMNLIDMCLQAVIYAEADAAPGHGALREFLDSSAPRVQTEVGRRLFAALERRFLDSL
ncbi:MAG: HD domain-containing protein [Spirochaetota bacterium]